MVFLKEQKPVPRLEGGALRWLRIVAPFVQRSWVAHNICSWPKHRESENMPESYRKYVQHMPETCPKHVKALPNHVERMPETCPKHGQHIPETCPKHAQHMPETCSKLAPTSVESNNIMKNRRTSLHIF